MIEKTTTTESLNVSKTYWSAVFTGTFIALATTLLFNLLGMSIGLSLADLNTEGALALSIGGIIWLILSAIIASFLGGWSTVNLAAGHYKKHPVLMAAITWTLATLIMLVLASTSFGKILSGVGSVIGKTSSAMALTVGATAPAMLQQTQNMQSVDSLINDIKTKATNMTSNQPDQNTKKELIQGIENFYYADNTERKQQARTALTQLLVENTDMNQTQAEQKIDEWQNSFNKGLQKTKEAFATASNIGAGVAFGLFITSILGLIAAIMGGMYSLKRT